MIIYIYCLIDPTTLEIRYIGKSVNPERRLKIHLARAKNQKTHVANWINKLRSKNLKPCLLYIDECNKENWQDRERFWIAYYRKSYDLTNILDGGEGGPTYGRLGKPWTSQQHINNRLARTGLKINQNDKHGNRKAGIIKYHQARKRAIVQYDLNGNFVEEWESIVDCAKTKNFHSSNIRKCCKYLRNEANGYIWRYKYE